MSYEEAAAGYDGLFTRPVDRWEDDHLADLLRPLVDGRSVLDLGCGTGWLLDHLAPAEYTGVDASTAMLAELSRKHPGAETIKAQVGSPGWTSALPVGTWDVVTSTWSLEYLGELAVLLQVLFEITPPRPLFALHGSMPRGHRRSHFSVKAVPYRPLGPHQVREASRAAGLPRPSCRGTSALPDEVCGLGRWWWDRALSWPAGMHYAALWTWDLR
jgi:predicted TPR repeat methyltransferase